MTAKELMTALNRFDGTAEVIIEVLTRKADTGELETVKVGSVDVVTCNGTIVYVSTWGQTD